MESPNVDTYYICMYVMYAGYAQEMEEKVRRKSAPDRGSQKFHKNISVEYQGG
jgi:hypothetical protein